MSYSWYLDGVEFGTGNTLSIAEADVLLEVGLALECVVDVEDSGGQNSQSNIQVSVSNSQPNIETVTLIRDGSELKCEADVEDVDEQELTVSYSWSYNGESIATQSNQSTLPVEVVLLQSESSVVCSVEVSDGIDVSIPVEGTTTIANTTASIDSLDFVTQMVDASSSIDADISISDPDGNASSSFVWYVDGVEQSEVSSSLSGVFSEGSVVTYQVLVTEAFADESVTSLLSEMSSGLTVMNAPPTIDTLEMVDGTDSETPLTTASMIVGSFEVSDIDEDDEIDCSYALSSATENLVESTSIDNQKIYLSICQHFR